MNILFRTKVILSSGSFAAAYIGYALLKYSSVRGNRPLVYAASTDILPIPNLADVENLKLLNVQIFFRHGARTPLRTEPLLEKLSEVGQKGERLDQIL